MGVSFPAAGGDQRCVARVVPQDYGYVWVTRVHTSLGPLQGSGESNEFGRVVCGCLNVWCLRTYAPAHVEEGMVVTFVFVSIAAAYCGDTIPCRREELAELAWLR